MVELLAFVPVIVSLFAMVDPIAAVPVFISLTQGYTREQKRRTARRAIFTAAAVLFVFGLAGDVIFSAFGITISAFRIAGGLLIFKYAFDMLHGERPGPDLTANEVGGAR